MADPAVVKSIMAAVSIPVMAKVRIGHIAEARILEQLGVDYIDESEVLTPADENFHLNKREFKTPFVCGARNLGEALRRIAEGAAMIPHQGRTRHRQRGGSRAAHAHGHGRAETPAFAAGRGSAGLAKEIGAPLELLHIVREKGALPVVNFAAGGISTPADAALMCSSAATAFSWARAFSSRRIRRALPRPL